MSYIPRVGAEALMPEEYTREIIENVPQMSSVMQLAYRAPNMSRAQRRMPVLSTLPYAYFVNPGNSSSSITDGDIKLKQTSRLLWENKYLDVEEMAVIVVIPEAVLDDADYDLWAEIKPKLLEAFGLCFDQAVYYGVNAPAVWPTNIVASAISAGNFVTLGGVGDVYDDILGEDGLIAKVEKDGYMVNGHVSAITMRGKLRGLRDNQNQPIFKALAKEGMQGSTVYTLDGEPMFFPRNGSIIPERSLIIAGDWTKLIYAIRKDITWKILDQSVIQDDSGAILYNMAQQDMVGLRAVMRLAWQVPNPINRIQPNESSRYPFAVLGEQGS